MSYDMKKREPHSPQNLTLDTTRIPWYINLGRSLHNYWLPLRFQSPILLQPLVAMNENVEDHDMST